MFAEAENEDITAPLGGVGQANVQCSQKALETRVSGTFGARARRIGLVSITIGLSACGAAGTADLNGAFASIQVDEARIEHASVAMETAGDDAARRTQREEVCAASSHLCDTARPLDDRDASTRCTRAEQRCARATDESAPRTP